VQKVNPLRDVLSRLDRTPSPIGDFLQLEIISNQSEFENSNVEEAKVTYFCHFNYAASVDKNFGNRLDSSG
jgi:hypothetical protein